MTTLKTPSDHVFDCFEKGEYEREVIVKEDRQHIAEVLCELLEAKKETPTSDYEFGFLEGIKTAQQIIRQTLEPETSSSELPNN